MSPTQCPYRAYALRRVEALPERLSAHDLAAALSPDDKKALATARARLALRGLAVDCFRDGSYGLMGVNIACWCRDLNMLVQIAALSHMIG